MKLLIEVTFKKLEGPTCDSDTVFFALEEHVDGEALYPQNPDKDDESTYEVQSVILKEVK